MWVFEPARRGKFESEVSAHYRHGRPFFLIFCHRTVPIYVTKDDEPVCFGTKELNVIVLMKVSLLPSITRLGDLSHQDRRVRRHGLSSGWLLGIINSNRRRDQRRQIPFSSQNIVTRRNRAHAFVIERQKRARMTIFPVVLNRFHTIYCLSVQYLCRIRLPISQKSAFRKIA